MSELSFAEKLDLIQKGDDDVLDKYAFDDDWRVRAAVAQMGRPQDLDMFRYDENESVLAAVAAQGREDDLFMLVNSDSVKVRYAVLETGNIDCLEILVQDTYKPLREAAEDRLKLAMSKDTQKAQSHINYDNLNNIAPARQ